MVILLNIKKKRWFLVKQFDIGDKVIVDNPFGSFHEKFRGMKGRVKWK